MRGGTITIAVVGGGFGGTYFLRELDRLRRSFPGEVRALLFEPRESFVFTPLLHELATAGLDEQHVSAPYWRLFDHAPWLTHLKEPVVRIDRERRIVKTATAEHAYDYLVLATGSETNYFGNASAQRYALPLKSAEDAARLRLALEQALLNAAREKTLELQQRHLAVAIVGGGPTGVELAPEILQFLHHRIKRQYTMIEKGAPSVTLIQGASVLLPAASARLQDVARRALDEKGVKVLANTRVESVTRGGLVCRKDGELVTVPAGTKVWVAGVTAHVVPGSTKHEYLIAQDLSLFEDGHVFAIGDAARYHPSLGLAPVPALAQSAVQEARHAARNLLLRVRGQPTLPFVYVSKRFLLSLGQRDATGEIVTPFGTLFLRGFFAWWLWRTIYLFKFVDSKQRLASASTWTARLFTRRSKLKTT